MKTCKYCNATEEDTKIINGDTCRKHYLQIRKYGKISRSIYDKNEITVIGNIASMNLYDVEGNVTAVTIFDSDKVSEVVKFKWYNKQGYVRGTNEKEKLFLHRFLTNCPDDKIIDHVDRNPLNNLSVNLRICSQAENTKNREYTRTNRHVGVKQTPSGKWTANITVMYTTIHLGTFLTYEEAVTARLLAETAHFKEFSRNT